MPLETTSVSALQLQSQGAALHSACGVPKAVAGLSCWDLQKRNRMIQSTRHAATTCFVALPHPCKSSADVTADMLTTNAVTEPVLTAYTACRLLLLLHTPSLLLAWQRLPMVGSVRNWPIPNKQCYLLIM